MDRVRRAGRTVGWAEKSVRKLVLRLAIDFLDDVLTVTHGGEPPANGFPRTARPPSADWRID